MAKRKQEQREPSADDIDKTPGFRNLERIGSMLSTLTDTMDVSAQLLVRNINAESTAFLVCTPWGFFTIHDNEHEDHWSGGIVTIPVTDVTQDIPEAAVEKLPGCFPLHVVLRLQLIRLLDVGMMKATHDFNNVPPPDQMH